MRTIYKAGSNNKAKEVHGNKIISRIQSVYQFW